jgi:hypothetical protein
MDVSSTENKEYTCIYGEINMTRKRSRPLAEPSVCGFGEEELYHGTSIESAKHIMEEGFVPDKKYNWQIKSKEGFVYLSKAYAPFYAMNAKSNSRQRVIVQTCVPENKLYPEDDFILYALGKPVYSQKDLDEIDLEDYKQFYKASLQYMGNASAKPEDIRIMGIRQFDASMLVLTCDPVISPRNYQACGEYYENLTKWIYSGKKHEDFPRMFEWLISRVKK